MDIHSKNFVLMPRHLRRFNGCLVKLFDGRRGKICYPYMIVSDGPSKLPMMLEKQENFKAIHQLIKQDTTKQEKIIALRKNKAEALRIQ